VYTDFYDLFLPDFHYLTSLAGVRRLKKYEKQAFDNLTKESFILKEKLD
jgi:hypothetical protein